MMSYRSSDRLYQNRCVSLSYEESDKYKPFQDLFGSLHHCPAWLLAQGHHGTVWQLKWGCCGQIPELTGQESSSAVSRAGKQQPQIVFSGEQRLRQ